MSVARTSERGNVRKEVLGSMVCAKLLKVMVAVLTVLSLVTLVPAQQVGRPSVQGLPNGVTRDGISIALAKLQRNGGTVKVWIAFRKVGHASGGASFHLNIRDDRGNIYPIDPEVGRVVVDLSLRLSDIGEGAVPVDLALLPVGFTWIASAVVEMPAKAPIHSISVYGDPLKDGVSLHPQSAKWPTIDLDVVRKNDLTGKKLRLSRDLTLWFGPPLGRQQGQTVLYRLPIYVENEDYNAHSLSMSVFKYYLYLETGEVVPLYVDPSVDPGVKRQSRLFHFGGLTTLNGKSRLLQP
jgi:hypothetical protein